MVVFLYMPEIYDFTTCFAPAKKKKLPRPPKNLPQMVLQKAEREQSVSSDD